MAQEDRSQGIGTLRGFAGMEQEKQREIARKGGANVPHDKRSFAQNRALAAAAGRKGGLMSQSRRHGSHAESTRSNGNGKSAD